MRTGRFPRLCAVALFLIFATGGVHGQTRVVEYTSSNEIFPNPERGMYTSRETGSARGRVTTYSPLELSDLLTVRTRNTLIYRYFGLKEWRTVELPASTLNLIQRDFELIRIAGLKCIVRFSYSNDIGEPDASLSTITRHLDQLGPILQANKDVIAVMQAGFIGAWGEWHSSTNNHDNTSRRRTILTKILNTLTLDRMVQVRSPYYKQEVFDLPYGPASALTASQAFNGSGVARTGHHNDCFLANETDEGTYWRDGRVDTADAKAYLHLDNRYVPMGGETCQPSSFATCANALSDLGRMRWSYLNEGYRREVLDGFIAGGCMDEIKRRLGYRFVLRRSEFPAAVKRGGQFRLQLRISNTGWASPFNPRLFEVLLRRISDGAVFCARLPHDPRYWLSGETIEIDVVIGVPTSVPSGNYSLLLNLPDPGPNLYSRSLYSIRLANENVWEQTTGYNSLLDSVFIDSSISVEPYRGTLWFRPLGEVHSEGDEPQRFSLQQNYPNPFNLTTTIPYSLAETSTVTLKVYDMIGQEVATLIDEEVMSSSTLPYQTHFVASDLASGVYFYRLVARPVEVGRQGFVSTQKLVVLK